MNIIKSFYDLDAWEKGHELVLKIYKMTEGFARFHFKDKIRFYYQAKGSIAEVQNFLLIARDLNYINNDKCAEIGELANEVVRLTNGLINSTNQQNNKQN